MDREQKDIILILSCVQDDILQTSEVSKTSEVSREINAILIAMPN